MILQIPSEKTDGNSYLITAANGVVEATTDGEPVILIDPGQGRALFDELSGKDYRPEYIFLTHEHFDHVENLEKVRQQYGAKVVACSLCSEGIQEIGTNLSAIADLLAYFKTGEIPEEKSERFTCNPADITYDEKYEMEWRGNLIRCQRAPGHSPGSVVITVTDAAADSSAAAFTGDYMIFETDEVLRLKGGSEEDFENFARPVLEEIPDGTRIYPGHGPAYTKGIKETPFVVPQNEKDALFDFAMTNLSRIHRRECDAYGDILSGLGQENPYLPVALFKNLELRSVPMEKVARQVTSSGTTGQQVSRIYLDGATAAAQQRALCMIAGDFIGGQRMPMLIIDSPDVLRDRAKFSARGAGILGFSIMASKRYYALDNNMELDWESIEEFTKKAAGGPSFAFGFTYMIWAYFYQALKKAGRTLDLEGCHLIHGGGWKKLQNQKVSDEVFRASLSETCGIRKVSDYYGMAEQTGSIFMQCQEGHLHASIYSDVEILNPEDFTPCKDGEWGLVALKSLLPKSYPGHMLLTEDWGRIVGCDDCLCGRKGRYFEISGRIKKAEIRGCSDTFAADRAKAVQTMNESKSDVTVLAGNYPVLEPVNEAGGRTDEIFSGETKAFLSQLSELFMKDPAYRQYPEIYALGFWCRDAHIQKLEKRQKAAGQHGLGLVLHITPSNMPTMFAYSWITSLLAGNSNIVRMSQRDDGLSKVILEGIRSVLDRTDFAHLKERNAFVTFPRESGALEELSQKAAARIIWGGDETVAHITQVPAAEGCVDITFPDKYSIAVIKASDIAGLDESGLRHQAHMFYNDTYGADQNACSSPKTIFWLDDVSAADGTLADIKDRWWNAVAAEADNYDLEPWMATEKFRMLCCAFAQNEGLGQVKRWGNRLYVVPWSGAPAEGAAAGDVLPKLEARMGMFYERDIKTLDEIMPLMGPKIQTVVASSGQEEIFGAIRNAGCEGVDRVVSMGEALDFDTIWDRKDLIAMLSE